ncbi:MAG: membrane dipeptidase [Butyricicoccus sp.]|nr:membrane dipeptidase [Butyricicoccus sp.]
MKYFDMHCDTLYELCHQSESLKDNEKLHISLNKSAHFAHYAQFFAMFCGTAEVEDDADADHRLSALLATAEREISGQNGSIRLCRTGDDLMQAQKDGLTAAFLTVEGADLLPNEAALQRAWTAGVRLVTLTWNHQNRYGCSAKLDQTEGLTREGLDFVRSCEEKHVLLDASHLSDAGFYDLLRHVQRPFAASHSNSRTVCPHFRNLTDEMFREIVDMGGVVGINLNPGFLRLDGGNSGAEIDDIVCHIEHFLDLGGEHTVCMGADWDGISSLPHGMDSIRSVTRIRKALAARGYDELLLDRIFYDNLAGFVSRWL